MNVSAAERAADPATTAVDFDWAPYSRFVRQLEAADGGLSGDEGTTQLWRYAVGACSFPFP